MKYVVAHPREAGKSSEVGLIDTMSSQARERTLFSLPEESLGKTYSPNGLYVSPVQGDYCLFVSVKDGVVVYDVNGTMQQHDKLPLDQVKAKEGVAGAMGYVHDTLYWSLTNFPYDLTKQQGCGLFRANGSSLEQVLEGAAPVGPLAVLGTGVLFYQEDDRENKEGRIFHYTQSSFAVSQNLERFSDIRYPQPVALCVDTHFVYSLGKRKQTGEERVTLTLFDHMLNEKAEHPIPLSDSVCTAFALYSGNFVPVPIPELELNFRGIEHIKLCSYGVIGLENGNIALIKIVNETAHPQLNLVAEFSFPDQGIKPVQNIFAVRKSQNRDGIRDAEIVVVYERSAVSLSSYHLLLRVAHEAAIGKRAEIIPMRFSKTDPGVHAFDRPIVASALVGVP